MLKIRLRRMGAKKAPFYRIVVADSRAPRGGAFVEEIGYYNPISEPVELKVDVEKARTWMKNGAQPTDTVRGLLKKSGAIESSKMEEEFVPTVIENDEIGVLVEYIAKNLVDDPDSVKVVSKKGEDSVIVELTVAKDDMGKVIGKQGRIAKAIRTVVRAASVKSETKYVVEII